MARLAAVAPEAGSLPVRPGARGGRRDLRARGRRGRPGVARIWHSLRRLGAGTERELPGRVARPGFGRRPTDRRRPRGAGVRGSAHPRISLAPGPGYGRRAARAEVADAAGAARGPVRARW